MATQFNEELWYGTDTRNETDAEALAAKSIAAHVGRVIGTKPFPVAAQRLTELTKDPGCPMDAVVEVLESDPALSARLLRLVNSSGFALRTSCSSVRHAAALVGNRRLNQVATTAAILDMFDASTELAAHLLEHATIVGALSRYLGAHFGLPPDEMFTCGFLHDIGKLMLLESEGEPYQKLIEQYQDDADVVYIKEREVYGYDHAILAGHVLSAWHIPAPVPQVVAWHHQITRAYEDSPQVAKMVSVLRLADSLAYSLFRKFPEFEVEKLARSEAASYLEISEPQIAAMWDGLYDLAERARAGFRGEEPKLQPRRLLTHSMPANDNVEVEQETSRGLPRQFPCVVCGVGSYANVCRVCHGYVCPNHQDPEDEWCALCWAEFKALEVRLPPWLYSLLGTAIGAMLVGTVAGASGAFDGEVLEWLIAPGLISLLAVVMLWTWHRWFRRVWFTSSAPDRTGLAPNLPNGPIPNVTDAGEPVPSMAVSKRIVDAFNLKAGGSLIQHIEPETSPLVLRAPAADGFVSALRPSRRSERASSKAGGELAAAVTDTAAPSAADSAPAALATDPLLDPTDVGVALNAVIAPSLKAVAPAVEGAQNDENEMAAEAFDNDDWLSDEVESAAEPPAASATDAALASPAPEDDPDFDLFGEDRSAPDAAATAAARPAEDAAPASALEPAPKSAQPELDDLFDEIADPEDTAVAPETLFADANGKAEAETADPGQSTPPRVEIAESSGDTPELGGESAESGGESAELSSESAEVEPSNTATPQTSAGPVEGSVATEALAEPAASSAKPAEGRSGVSEANSPKRHSKRGARRASKRAKAGSKPPKRTNGADRAEAEPIRAAEVRAPEKGEAANGSSLAAPAQSEPPVSGTVGAGAWRVVEAAQGCADGW